MFPRNRTRRLPLVALALFCASAAFGAPKKKSSNDAGVPPKASTPDAGFFEPFAWDIPDIMEVIDVQGEMMSAGIPVRASAVRTKASGEPLVKHIFESFRRAGLFIPVPATMTQIDTLPQITGYDTVRQLGYTAMFQANPDGTTTLILTEADMGARLAKGPGTSRLPLPPDAKSIIRSRVEGAEVVTYRTTVAPEKLVELYGSFAMSTGLRADADSTNDALSFSGESGALTVSLASKADAGTQVTVVDRRGMPATERLPE